MKTWKVRRWVDRPHPVRRVMLACPVCGTDAAIELGMTPGAALIAAIGLSLLFDPPGYVPPENTMPDEVQCRTCRKIFASQEVADVR